VTGPAEEWDGSRLPDLAALVDRALPGENLSADDLGACCFDDGTVLGLPDGSGAVSVWVSSGDSKLASVKLLAVDPDAARRRIGRGLLDAAVGWAGDHGAVGVGLGGSVPFYLWPGVDVGWTPMLCLAEAAGFVPTGAALNMSCATTFRARDPAGITVERVISEEDARGVAAWCERHWPHWVPELRRGIEHGSCLVAWSAEHEPTGFACHSVNRGGWFGPTGTDPQWRRRGIGAALFGAACRDLMSAGYKDVEISWVGPIGFYARAAGATVSRVFQTSWRSLR
jgi:mycothiol synthase